MRRKLRHMRSVCAPRNALATSAVELGRFSPCFYLPLHSPRRGCQQDIVGRLVLILVFSITLLRRNALLAKAEEVWRQYFSTSLKTPSE